MTRKLLYRINPYNGGIVFADPDRARLVHRINSAIESSKTWGEFRKAMPRMAYSEIVRGYDENGEERPRGTDPFNPELLLGFSDGDYPPWLQQEMNSILRLSFLQEFGERVTTILNGYYWMIPKSNLAPACAALKQLGYQVEEAPELEFH